MSEDRLLDDLADLARGEGLQGAPLDERWDRLAAGELNPEEEEELRALAEASPDAREAYEAFRPLGAEFQARVAEALAGELSGRNPRSTRAGPREPRFRLLSFPHAAGRFAGWATAAAAAAAVTMLLLLRGPAPSLPFYNAQLSPGVKISRGGPDQVTGLPLFVPGTQLTFDARPERPVADPIEARCFLGRGKEIVLWSPQPRLMVDSQGAVRLRGTVGRELRIPPGDWTIWIVVARADAMPSAAELSARLRGEPRRNQHAGWQAVSGALRVEDRPAP